MGNADDFICPKQLIIGKICDISAEMSFIQRVEQSRGIDNFTA